MPTPRKYDKNMTQVIARRFTPEVGRKVHAAGTSDFWRPVEEQIAVLKLKLDAGEIQLPEFQEQVGKAVATIAVVENPTGYRFEVKQDDD